jgi:hypothetical protein
VSVLNPLAFALQFDYHPFSNMTADDHDLSVSGEFGQQNCVRLEWEPGEGE